MLRVFMGRISLHESGNRDPNQYFSISFAIARREDFAVHPSQFASRAEQSQAKWPLLGARGEEGIKNLRHYFGLNAMPIIPKAQTGNRRAFCSGDNLGGSLCFNSVLQNLLERVLQPSPVA